MTQVETYKGYVIWTNGPSPLPGRHMDWHWSLQTDDPDSFDNGHAATLDDCKRDIDMWLDMQERADSPEGRAESERMVDRAMLYLNHVMMAQCMADILSNGHAMPKQQHDNATYLVGRFREMRPGVQI